MIVPDWSGTIPVVNGDADSGGTVDKAVSGGTSTFGWSAPSGLENGKTITVSSDTLAFNAPDKHVYLGFGQGWLYDNPDETQLTNVSVGAEVIEYEGVPDPSQVRKIKTIDGVKFLTSRLHNTGNAGGDADGRSGFISWDTGSEITNGNVAFTFAVSRCTPTIQPNAYMQWKQERITHNKNLIGDNFNTAYISEAGENGGGTWPRVVVYPGDGVSTPGFSTPTPIHNGKLNAFAWVWNPNTPDLSDGHMYTRRHEEGVSGFSLSTPTGGADPSGPCDDLIKSNNPERIQWLTRQDFIGNVALDTCENVDVDVTDIYWKINGDLFLLSDSSDLDLCVERPIPLIPTAFSSDKKAVTLNLWKGAMSSYTGKYIVHLDSKMTTLNTVAL